MDKKKSILYSELEFKRLFNMCNVYAGVLLLWMGSVFVQWELKG